MAPKAKYRNNIIMLLSLASAKKTRVKETYLISVLAELDNGVILKKFILII